MKKPTETLTLLFRQSQSRASDRNINIWEAKETLTEAKEKSFPSSRL